MSNLATFSAQLLRRPREVSALAPSSRALCRMMAAQIPASAMRVAEFGPGTGNITREILRSGIEAGNLSLFEINPPFCQMLRKTYPGVHVFNEPAERLALAGPELLDAVVSGLPLLSMSPAQQEAIVSAAFSRLAPDGVYIQFTYGPVSPLRESIAQRLGLTHTRTRRIWLNLPPATVYVYKRAKVAGAA
jgi:phosphatidylethanolamine/phosphatidyl-N-methylethanolamine N-methyltransferase